LCSLQGESLDDICVVQPASCAVAQG
jgi:hypothetical protein